MNSSIFILRKKKILKRLSIKLLVYQYHNFKITVHTDIENQDHVMFYIENIKIPDITLVKLFHDEASLSTKGFVAQDIRKMDEFVHELIDAIEIAKHSNELDQLVIAENATDDTANVQP